jgi:hypothetical protein
LRKARIPFKKSSAMEYVLEGLSQTLRLRRSSAYNSHHNKKLFLTKSTTQLGKFLHGLGESQRKVKKPSRILIILSYRKKTRMSWTIFCDATTSTFTLSVNVSHLLSTLDSCETRARKTAFANFCESGLASDTLTVIVPGILASGTR